MRVCINITLAGMGISTFYFRAMMKMHSMKLNAFNFCIYHIFIMIEQECLYNIFV